MVTRIFSFSHNVFTGLFHEVVKTHARSRGRGMEQRTTTFHEKFMSYSSKNDTVYHNLNSKSHAFERVGTSMIHYMQDRQGIEPRALEIPSRHAATELLKHITISFTIYHQIPVLDYMYIAIDTFTFVCGIDQYTTKKQVVTKIMDPQKSILSNSRLSNDVEWSFDIQKQSPIAQSVAYRT